MKTIFISNSIKTQESLPLDVKVINNKMKPEDKLKAYSDFNLGHLKKIALTKSVVINGGIKYNKNEEKINVEFLSDIDEREKPYILSRMNINHFKM